MVLLRRPSTGPAARQRYSSATIAPNPAVAQRLDALHPTGLSAAARCPAPHGRRRAEQAADRAGGTLLARGVYRAPPVKEAILDGEVVALDSEGRQNFRDLRASRGNLHYAAFDPLWVEGKDLRPLLLIRRKQMLTRLIPATTTVLSQIFSIEERGRDLFAAAERLDLEGIVAKRKADAYRPDTVWYKVKSRTYTQGEGRWELFRRN
jgi:ATP-dependent DNA ligase